MYARALCMHSSASACIHYINLGACYARRVKLRHCHTELIFDWRSSISSKYICSRGKKMECVNWEQQYNNGPDKQLCFQQIYNGHGL